MRTHQRKILRDVLSRKVRTVLVTLSIFIGVLGVIALLTVRDLITRQLQADVQEDDLSMIDIDVSLKSGATADNEPVLQFLNRQSVQGQTLAPLEGIERVEGQAYFPIKFRLPGEAHFTEGEIRAYSSPLQEVQLEPMRLAGGAWPAVGRNEVALEKRMAERYGFKTGDAIVFRTGSREVTYRVVGLVFHPYSYKRPSTTGALTPGPEDGIYAQYEDARALLGFDGFNRFVARYHSFAQAEKQFEAFQNLLLQETPYIPRFPLLENPAENGQILNAETFGNILSLLAIVAMIVSGFLVVNVVNTIVAEQKRQIGVMKSLGATRLDNFIIYAGIALCYGLIGTVLAILPGVLVGYQLALVLAPQLDVLIESFAWSVPSVLTGMVLGVVVPVLAAMLPVYNGTKVTILEAMTDLGIDSTYGQGPAARFISKLPAPTILRQAVSNLAQKKGRLALTGVTLTSAIGASMGVFAMGISLNNAVKDIFDRLNYEITILPTALQDMEEAKQVAESLDSIEAAHPGVIASVQIEGDYENFFTRNNQVVAFGIEPAARDYRYKLQAGRGWLDDPQRAGVVISAPMADQLGVTVGDSITFVIGGNRVTAEIIGVEGAAFDALWMRWERLAELAGFIAGGPQANQYFVPASVSRINSLTVAVGINADGARVLSGIPLPDNGVFITESLAATGHLGLNDTVSITLAGQTVERTVVGVVANMQLATLATTAQPVPANLVFFDFNDLVALTGAALGNQPVPNGYYVATTLDDPTPEEVDEVIDEIAVALGEAGINSELQNQVKQFTDITELIVQYTAILSLAAILIALVGAIGLLTTLSITVFERQKEIGVMRSIGAGSARVATQFMLEGMLVGFVAWILGIPISYGLALMLNAAFRLETVKFEYPPEVLILGLVGILAMAALASLGPSVNAARKTVSEILRYQ